MPGRWNPARGNRKAGTRPRRGWRWNRMTIPEPLRLDHYGTPLLTVERMDGAITSRHLVHGRGFLSLWQAPRIGFGYGCTPGDVAALLNLLPAADVAGLNIVAFRQPTRKESMLAPVWGRLVFHAILPGYEGTCLMIEAAPIGRVRRFGRRISLADADEMRRLRDDGHRFVADQRGWSISGTAKSIRNTVLYRTVPHEVGHWVDFCHHLKMDADFWSRPPQEREVVAHRYASERMAELRRRGLIPFGTAPEA